MTAGAPKSPNNVTSTFSKRAQLLLKELRFEHWGAKLVSCPGRHLTSVPPLPGGVKRLVSIFCVVALFSITFKTQACACSHLCLILLRSFERHLVLDLITAAT